jgi:hypothetical protein
VLFIDDAVVVVVVATAVVAVIVVRPNLSSLIVFVIMLGFGRYSRYCCWQIIVILFKTTDKKRETR